MHTRKKALYWGSLFLSLFLVLILIFPQTAPAAKKKPIYVGEINSYSGLATVFTFPYKDGIEMALKEINDAGGVLGRPMEFIFRDDKLRADEAVKAARELIYQEKVDMLAGCISSSVGLALSSWSKQNKIVYFATHCQSSRITWDDGHAYVAHTTNNVNQYTRALAKLAATYPYKKWAHISPDYEYGHNMWEEFWSYLKQLRPDVEAVQENWPKLGETDHSAYITALLQSGAEAFFSALWGSQEISFVKQGGPYGLFDKLHFFSPALGNPDELTPIGEEAPIGAAVNGFPWYDPGLQKAHPQLANWVEKYMKWSKGKEPKLGASWGYATAYIIAEAIKRANSADTKKIVAVLDKGFEMDFPWGRVLMRGCDHQALPPQWLGIIKMNPEGKPIMAEVTEIHGEELVRSCDEVRQLRKRAVKK